MHTLLLTVLIIAASPLTTHAQLSTPPRPLGFSYGGAPVRPKVEVAIYLDPTCPDSKDVYPTMLAMAQEYSLSDVQLRMYLFPLPYHRNSHVISKAAHVMAGYPKSKPSPSTVFQWINTTFSAIDELSTSGSAKLSDSQVLDILAGLAKQVASISRDDFISGVSDRDIDLAARLEWKYCCTRGAYGTPMFTVNDVFVAANSWSLQQWKAAVDKLLKG